MERFALGELERHRIFYVIYVGKMAFGWEKWKGNCRWRGCGVVK